jgi:hypothetical protein
MILVVSLSLLFGEKISFGQNLFEVHVRNAPRVYGPRDPWEVGPVMRHSAGWSGLFYNCDCEEHKRLSPYIRWEQQPVVCCPHGHCWDIHQQIDEVKQRIRTGSCQQCEFKLCPRCSSSEPPIRPTCADGTCSSQSCPTCGTSIGPHTSPTRVAQDVKPSPDASTGWMSKLYFAR